MVEANPPAEQQPDNQEVEVEEGKESALRDNIKRKGANSVSDFLEKIWPQNKIQHFEKWHELCSTNKLAAA